MKKFIINRVLLFCFLLISFSGCSRKWSPSDDLTQSSPDFEAYRNYSFFSGLVLQLFETLGEPVLEDGSSEFHGKGYTGTLSIETDGDSQVQFSSIEFRHYKVSRRFTIDGVITREITDMTGENGIERREDHIISSLSISGRDIDYLELDITDITDYSQGIVDISYSGNVVLDHYIYQYSEMQEMMSLWFADKYENDDLITMASKIMVGERQERTFHRDNKDDLPDIDWFTFDVESGKEYIIETFHSGIGADTEIFLFSDTEMLLDRNVDKYMVKDRPPPERNIEEERFYFGKTYSRIYWKSYYTGEAFFFIRPYSGFNGEYFVILSESSE